MFVSFRSCAVLILVLVLIPVSYTKDPKCTSMKLATKLLERGPGHIQHGARQSEVLAPPAAPPASRHRARAPLPSAAALRLAFVLGTNLPLPGARRCTGRPKMIAAGPASSALLWRRTTRRAQHRRRQPSKLTASTTAWSSWGLAAQGWHVHAWHRTGEHTPQPAPLCFALLCFVTKKPTTGRHRPPRSGV